MACFAHKPWPSLPPAPVVKRGEPITLNFTNADIEAVARTMATLTGRNVVVDPRVKGTITLTTDRPVSAAVAYNQFLAMLRLQGYTVVDSAGLDKIVPEADAKLQGGGVFSGDNVGNGQIATQIFKLNFENANNLVPILRPLISPNNTINVNPGNNSLVITDYGDNLRRLAKIIAAMDVSNATDVEVINVKHALAVDLAPLVLRLLESGSARHGRRRPGRWFVQDHADCRATQQRADPARGQPGPRGAGQVPDRQTGPTHRRRPGRQHLRGLSEECRCHQTGRDTARRAVGRSAYAHGHQRGSRIRAYRRHRGRRYRRDLGGASSSQPSTGGQIQADAATNSLIISAPEPQYRQLRAVIDKLDARRAQVYVESLIAEVNADKAAEFGIQWQGALGKNGDTNVGLLGTNFSIGGANLIKLATQAATGAVAPSTGLNMGVANQTNGVYVLGFLARFLQTNGDGNILSTPNLLTLDNEEAKIIIAQNVPFVTGQFTNTGAGGTSGSVNPFQTIERKDVGITLKVKPQISENGTVKTDHLPRGLHHPGGTVNSANGPTTNKRSIEVQRAGGAMARSWCWAACCRMNTQATRKRYPAWPSIPLLGNLFKSEARSRKKIQPDGVLAARGGARCGTPPTPSPRTATS